MTEFLSFFIVILAGLFSSQLFGKLHLPWVITLMIGGIFIGPFGIGLFEPNATMEFLGEIGLVFLMFMAGLETRISTFEGHKKEVAKLAILNGLIPAMVGFLIAYYFGYGFSTSLLLAVIFISSSIAIIIPTLESKNLLNTRLGKSIIATTVFEDITSLILLSFLLQTINPLSKIPLPLFYVLLFVTLIALRWVMPKIRWFLNLRSETGKDRFEQELRSIFVILIGTVVLFELLGLHAIVAGFFAGLILSENVKSKVLFEKLHAISYGIFVPIFFVIIGTKTNFRIFAEAGNTLFLTIAIVAGLVLAKFISGWIGAKSIGFTGKESALVGAATIPQLSTTLAAAFTGLAIGIIDEQIITALIILSIITTFLGPLLISVFTNKITKDSSNSSSIQNL
jgi:Kef-type K+ transport system membrane component KefB